MKTNQPGQLFKFSLWKRVIEDLRLLFSLLKDYWKGDYRDISSGFIVVFLLTVVYILCPIDLISDFIPFAGQIDDALILLLGLYLLEKDLYKYKKWKNQSHNEGES